MASEYIGALHVLSAQQLPKTDTFSKIDSYVVVKYGGQKFSTKAIDDNDNPTYNEAFYPTLMADPSGFLQGQVEFEVWDKNTFKDTKVAEVAIELAGRNHVQLKGMQLSLVYAKAKYKGQSFLNVSFEGFVQSYASLKRMMAGVPGFTFNDVTPAAYVPIAGLNNMLYVALEWEAGGNIDVKLLETCPNAGALFTDLLLSGAARTKTRRRAFPHGMPIAPGLVAYEEVKLDNVKVGTDFNQLAVLVHDGQPAGITNAASVVEHHGWRGSLGFQNACALLRDIEVDHKEQEIYMAVPSMPGEVMLVVDWDSGNVDIKLGVFPHPGTNDKAYELTIRAGGCNKRVMELYTPPRPKLGGRYQFGRIFELDDVPYGTAFKDMQILRYQLSNPRSFNVQQVTRVMG